MPKFDFLPRDLAVEAIANPKQRQIGREYVGYVDTLEAGQLRRLGPAQERRRFRPRKSCSTWLRDCLESARRSGR